jgi:hypothetical protein
MASQSKAMHTIGRMIIGATLGLMFASAPALSNDNCEPGAILLFASRCEPVADAKQPQCDNASIVVHSKRPRDAVLGYEGADSAIRFLGALGLAAKGTVELRIVEALPKTADPYVMGYYSRSKRSAYLLSFSEIEKRGAPFDVPLDPVLYRSMAAHEVAHIIIARNFSIPEPQIKAKEYLAYVTMFATMPADFRQRLLKNVPHKAFESEMDINAMLYLFDPVQFGVKAYTHYLKLPDKPTFVHRILAGQALATELLY